ncbi:hypothetical protein BCR36DRAFT_580847 [Piromyces finnis]|uniref:Uncharacterized protein n=1 Tax=Piromyces finnis TaxID=1754191 RepID=A0A1Y1VIM3_9FUNG|nr:hypothetical protein BCR36DRAFT_580847 [Piromyces finnis]|eukprot:ORX56538.1 hypothetical protein BCR36DRAFT_580847 [Piromyces finnis]
MGKHTAINNNNNSSNVLSQQKILNDLQQMNNGNAKAQMMNQTNSKKNGGKKQQQKQQQKQQVSQQPKQQQQKQQVAQQPKQQQQQTKKSKPLRLSNAKLLSYWISFNNKEWMNSGNKSFIKDIKTFINRNDIRKQLEGIQEIQIKYTFKPEKSKAKRNEERKQNKKQLKAATNATFPPSMHSYRRKQLVQEMNERKQQKATHDRVINLMVKRYSQKMDKFAEEYQKAYKTYQANIKENLCLEEIHQSKINAHKMNSRQRRLQKKAKLQKKYFKSMNKRVLESHTCPAQWTANHEKLFQTATQKILCQGFDGFHYFGRPEYNRSLAWVEANENSTTKDSISVASVLACQNSPIPDETRLASNRVATLPASQKKSTVGCQEIKKQQKPQQQQQQQKSMTIKTQTPEQYRQRISGGKKQQQQKKLNKNNESTTENNNNNKNRKNNVQQRKMEDKPVSPSIVNPGPATWVTESELPDNFAWGILQHRPNGGNKRRSGGSKKNTKEDESLHLLFPKSAPNNNNNNNGAKKQSRNNNNNNNKRQNKKQQGYNISEML